METNFFTEKELKDRSRMLESAMSEHTSLREALKKHAGEDPESIDWEKVSFKELRDRAKGELMEATNVVSTQGQLFRYGIQKVLFDGYKDVPTVYPDVVQFVPSSNRQEWYAPLYGAEVPTDVAFGGKFPDSRIKGLDTVLVNKKIGRMLSLERELFDYDQTGQVVTKASQMGKRVRYKEETDVMAAIFGATYSTAIGNRPSSYANLNQFGMEAADIALMNMVDPLGNNMLVMPSLLLVSTADKFNAAKLLNSSLQPSIPGASGKTASSGDSGTTGWTMTINPLQGLYSLKVSRFITANRCYLMEPKISIVFQEASPVEIVQENPLSGMAFENDIYRWRVRRLYQVAVLESRYIYAIQNT